MSDEVKKFEVEIDAVSYEAFKACSEEYNYDDEVIVNYIMENALKK